MYAKNSPQILCVLKTTQQGLFRRSMAPNKPMTKGMQVVFHSTSFVTTSCVCFFSIRRCFEEVKWCCSDFAVISKFYDVFWRETHDFILHFIFCFIWFHMISYYLSDIVSVVLLLLNIVAFEPRRGLDVRLRCAGGLQVEGIFCRSKDSQVWD